MTRNILSVQVDLHIKKESLKTFLDNSNWIFLAVKFYSFIDALSKNNDFIKIQISSNAPGTKFRIQ